MKRVPPCEDLPVLINRVPQVTALFWILKLLTTGIGETASDFLVKSFDPVPVVLGAAALFVVTFILKVSAARYSPWRYWLFVLMVAVFGTMVADVTHLALDVPYAVSTTVFAVVLGVVFVVWWRVERTVSIHDVTSRRREIFYWSAVLVTFALGTAFGDLTAVTLGLGYLASGLIFAVLFALPLVLTSLRVAEITTFWIAYALTRPLGASFADWIAVDGARGGLAAGTGVVSVVGLAIIAVVIAVAQRRQPS
ncbi:MAG: hypothetical protein BGO97_02550 [Micrococcales bacterium 70-64]|nr:hypothetical protein [Leifsonia sp.]ODU66077.1 MAG: hypothetical protein ABT06_02555 [Leifsonia sp. SCN 70-46]OJX84703.1 MAG: hypothetical protein BGO97_02550 [Micrococcales bacterium 70-64]